MVGSVEQRGTKNWRLVVPARTNIYGKRVKITRTIRGDRREAEHALAKLVTEVDQHYVGESARMTLSQWYDVWFTEHVEKHLAKKTQALYRFIFETRVLPLLGQTRLDRLNQRDIIRFVETLTEKGIRRDGRGDTLSSTSQLRHFRVLSACLQEAVYRGHISINPSHNVRAPRRDTRPQAFYTEEQVAALLQALSVEPPRLRAMILLAVTTGLRRGELIALQWEHVDFDERTLRIEQAAEYISGHPQSVKSTKTPGSNRTISLPAMTLEALRVWQVEQADERARAGSLWQPSDFLFTQPLGEWLRVDEVSKQFRRFLDRHHLPQLHFHGLRHTAASLLIAQGVPIRTVSGILGHSNGSTTLNIYSHLMPNSVRQAADLMDTLLSK